MASPLLTIVLPAYNEETRLGPALDELIGYLRGPGADDPRLPDRIQILVVDDGSVDRTSAIVRGRPEYRCETTRGTEPAAEGVKGRAIAASVEPPARTELVLELLAVPHGGKGAAVRTGMLAADGDIVVFADADMATPPDQLPLLVGALTEEPGADVALGSRVQPDGSDMRASQPPFRRLIGRVFRAAAGLWVTGHVADTQCGFKGFRRAVARDLFARQRITSIVFDVELIYLARRRGYRIAIVPVVWGDRRGSRMHARPGLALRVAWDLLRIRLIHRHVARTALADAET